jgi:hypothetical protein
MNNRELFSTNSYRILVAIHYANNIFLIVSLILHDKLVLL